MKHIISSDVAENEFYQVVRFSSIKIDDIVKILGDALSSNSSVYNKCFYAKIQLFLPEFAHSNVQKIDALFSKYGIACYNTLVVCDQLGGAIIHGIKGNNYTIKNISFFNNSIHGTILDRKGTQCISLLNLHHSDAEPRDSYTKTFELLEKYLHEHQEYKLVRTWCWIKDILMYYSDFNAARNEIYSRMGFIKHGDMSFPASTGVGIPCSIDRALSLDCLLYNKDAVVEYHYKTKKQNSAYAYGSAFARMASIKLDYRTDLYLSGTAAILQSGDSLGSSDTGKQLDNTYDNVINALSELNMGFEDIQYVILYCKNKAVYEYVSRDARFHSAPVLFLIAEICRGELLLEMEIFASKANGSSEN